MGPVPIAARYFTAAARAEIDFDAGLQPGLKFAPNWTFRFSGFGWGTNVVSVGMPQSRVVCTAMIAGPPDPGPNVVNYAAGIPDIIRASDGVPAAAFAGYPITILP